MIAQTVGKAYDDERGGVVVYTSRPDVPNLSDDVMIVWQDRRDISPGQRKLAWVLMTAIAEYQGEDKEEVYSEQKNSFFSQKYGRIAGATIQAFHSHNESGISVYIHAN